MYSLLEIELRGDGMMCKVVVSEFMDEQAVNSLGDCYDVVFDTSLVDDRAALLHHVRDASALIVRNRTMVDAELLDAAPSLQVVGRLGVGLDNIDVSECESRDVIVKPAFGGNGSSVAEYVLAGAMMLRRNAYFSTEAVLSGKWPRQELIGREVSGSKLGLVGFGTIARETARRAEALDMHVMAYDPFLAADDPKWGGVERYERLLPLLEAADIISLHVPLTPDTRHLIDGVVLKSIKSSAVIINAARGGVIDEHALAQALRDGSLAGALLDVYEQEPLPAGSELRDVPNLILTPHIAGVTEESNARISQMTADNVRAVLEQHSAETTS